MGLDEKATEHIDRILARGERVLSTARWSDEDQRRYKSALESGIIDEWDSIQSEPDRGTFVAWKIQALVFLKGLLPEDHHYVKQFEGNVYVERVEHVQTGQELLQAIREDLEVGLLTSIRSLVAGELFDDFLEMATHLLEEGYKDASASLAGAVLEDSLRKIAARKNITVKDREDINSLAQKCADKEVYGRFTQKKISVYADIRNNAAHGKFDQYSNDDVADMVRGIRVLLSEHLE